MICEALGMQLSPFPITSSILGSDIFSRCITQKWNRVNRSRTDWFWGHVTTLFQLTMFSCFKRDRNMITNEADKDVTFFKALISAYTYRARRKVRGNSGTISGNVSAIWTEDFPSRILPSLPPLHVVWTGLKLLSHNTAETPFITLTAEHMSKWKLVKWRLEYTSSLDYWSVLCPSTPILGKLCLKSFSAAI
jgi:hypothetical protein